MAEYPDEKALNFFINFINTVQTASLRQTPRNSELEEIAHNEYCLSANRAILALKKQVPKKPPNHDRTECPNCNSKARYGRPYEYYCCHCGQAIDWNEDN